MANGRSWSYWSRNKLDILRDYLPAFNTASKKASERIYIDLMAGQPENEDRHTGERFDGSARLAMAAIPGFTRLAFGELEANAVLLRTDLQRRHPGGPFRVYAGDCNNTISQILADLADVNWAPTFAFLDQQAAEVRWETIVRLAAFRRAQWKVEQWILCSPAMIVREAQKEEFASRVDQFYGSGRWRQILAARHSKSLTPGEFRAEMVNLLRWQLEKGLRYKYTVRIPMRMTNGIDIYDMVFATDHDAGLNIMSYLYKKAAEREPRMRDEAVVAQTGQPTLFEDTFTSMPEWRNDPCWDPASRPWWRR